MTKKCCVCGYKSSSEAGVSFHEFPSNETIRDQWISNLGLAEAKARSVVCSKHFYKDQFIEGRVRKVLKPDQVPIRRLPVPTAPAASAASGLSGSDPLQLVADSVVDSSELLTVYFVT